MKVLVFINNMVPFGPGVRIGRLWVGVGKNTGWGWAAGIFTGAGAMGVNLVLVLWVWVFELVLLGMATNGSMMDLAAGVSGCFFLMCSLSRLIEVKPDSQFWHRNGLSPECWKRWRTSEFLWRNCNLQTWQVNCFSVRWTCKRDKKNICDA